MTREPVPRNEIRVEYTALSEIRKWPGNPKSHDLGAIAASALRHGFRDPIAVNRRSHEIEEGHGRLDTLQALKQQGRAAPSFVRVEGGEWFVPVIYFDDDEQTQHGYALAHNRTQELGGAYDERKLLAALMEQARHGLLPGTGFDSDDLEALHRKFVEDSTAPIQETAAHYRVIVDCEGEAHQIELLERFQQEGLPCRALVN